MFHVSWVVASLGALLKFLSLSRADLESVHSLISLSSLVLSCKTRTRASLIAIISDRKDGVKVPAGKEAETVSLFSSCLRCRHLCLILWLIRRSKC